MKSIRQVIFCGILCAISLLSYKSSFAQCDASLWNHVYHNYRLYVHDSCVSASGTIWSHSAEADGDIHIRLTVDSPFLYMLNAANISDEYGKLVCEPVCVDTITQADAVSSCVGFTNTVYIPANGEHVVITGPYVTDNDHGWNEIHPITSITIVTAALSAQNVTNVVTPGVTIYPNPAKSVVNFKLSQKPSSVVYITISDELGRLAGQYQMLEMVNLQVQTRYLPAGKYYYNVAENDRSIGGGTFVVIK